MCLLSILQGGPYVPIHMYVRTVLGSSFQQNGPPARYALSVRHYVPDIFRHKWIGRGSVTSPGRIKYPGDKNISEHKVPHIIMQQLRGAVHKCTGYMDG